MGELGIPVVLSWLKPLEIIENSYLGPPAWGDIDAGV